MKFDKERRNLNLICNLFLCLSTKSLNFLTVDVEYPNKKNRYGVAWPKKFNSGRNFFFFEFRYFFLFTPQNQPPGEPQEHPVG